MTVAAEAALRLKQEMARLDPMAHRLPAELALRVGAHVGPAFPVENPVSRRRNYFGSPVSWTARIEPVTPVNEVYVTEMFAAGLALAVPERLAMSYVGMVPAAKDYGTVRMSSLKRGVPTEPRPGTRGSP